MKNNKKSDYGGERTTEITNSYQWRMVVVDLNFWAGGLVVARKPYLINTLRLTLNPWLVITDCLIGLNYPLLHSFMKLSLQGGGTLNRCTPASLVKVVKMKNKL